MKWITKSSAVISWIIILVISWNAQNSKSLRIEIQDQQSDIVSQGEVRIMDPDGIHLFSKILKDHAVVVFDNILTDKVVIEIESPGFEKYWKIVRLKDGINSYLVRMEVKIIEVEITVEQSEIDRRLSRAFSGFLSQEEIDSLPDDPRKIREELKRRYGEDLIIRINGFTGGQIPPKQSIRSIQVSRSSFDAEFHELGRPNINIITKASIPSFIGMIGLNYGNSATDARNAFASEKLPTQNTSIVGFLSGPINKQSSFTFSINKFSNLRKETIFAQTPQEIERTQESTALENQSISGEINYDISSNHTARLAYQNNLAQNENVGIGGLNLVERGFGSKLLKNEIRVSSSGAFSERITTQFRSRFSLSSNQISSNSSEVGIVVPGVFNSGGSGLDSSSKTKKFEAFELISFGFGKHFIKTGVEFNFENRKVISSNGTNGSFLFPDFGSFLLRNPSLYRATLGTSNISFNRYDFSIFAQDDFRIAKRIQLGLGLRYEIQNRLSDFNNFSPRLSIAFAIDEKAKFVLRSGAGILNQWYGSENIQRILANDGNQSRELIILNPRFLNPLSVGDIQEPLPPSILRQAENLENPSIFTAQSAINIDLGNNIKFDISYRYTRGIHLFRSRDTNAPINGFRRNPNFGRIRQFESSGTLTRNLFEISGKGVIYKRVRVSGRYRLAKTVDDFSGVFTLPMDNFNLSIERATSSIDRRHRFTTQFNYSPFRDFQINPTFTIASPLPYTISTGFDNNRDSVFNDRPLGLSRNTERGAWTNSVNLGINWSIPIFKRSIKVSGKAAENIPSALKYHKINFSINARNLLNSTNRSGYIGNQLSPFFNQPTIAGSARNFTFGLTFLYF